LNLAFRLAAGDPGDASALPGSLHVNRRLSQWLRFLPEGIVEVRSGKVELGQGIATALAQIAAEELDVSLARIRMVPARTGESPDEAVTSGSLSIQESGTALRYACAEARALFLAAAALRLEAETAALGVRDGEISAPGGGRTTYWELARGDLLEREATAAVPPKEPSAHRVVGTSAARLDLPDKVFGAPRYVHDMELPHMLHGRVLRPAGPLATLSALEETEAKALPGVQVVRDGSFVGVLAEREETALKALKKLKPQWSDEAALPDCGALAEWLKAQPSETVVVEESGEPAPAARSLRARYTRPYTAHASIGPSCALAQWREDKLFVWTHSQGIYNLRADLALVFDLSPEAIVVEHVEGAGCYGHNGADDVALDAALLARAAGGRPVKLVWSREDELGWAPFGPAMLVELEADLDERGEILAWRHELWSNGHSSRPGRARAPTLLAARHLGKPFEAPVAINPPPRGGGGAERNAVPGYAFPARRVRSQRVLEMPIRTSALRSLGAFANVFAIESFMDEIAAQRREDPLALRLRLLPDARGRAVIEAAAGRFGWRAWKPREGSGRGIGYARYKNVSAYCAVAAEIEAGREIRVVRLVAAVDVGLVINPDGVRNQIEGGAIQAASWTTREAVRFDRTRITSASWEDYPILRFSEVPAVEIELLSRPAERPLGAGEAAQGPTAAAIANAVCDALGVRVRDLPLSAERIVAAAGF
jgi:nicotinate dehydrogenase subunit B